MVKISCYHILLLIEDFTTKNQKLKVDFNNHKMNFHRGQCVLPSNTIEQEYTGHDYGIIDHGTYQGHKLYDRATSELNEIKYRCNLEDLSAFINDLSNGAFALG